MSKKLKTYINDSGIPITVYATMKPRKEERTWIANSKYSIFNIGHQAAMTGRRGIKIFADKKI
jgi:hypothetical protein